MPPSEPLPRPAEWAIDENRKHKAALALVVALAGGCLVVALGFAQIGRSAAVKYSLLLGVLFLLTAGFGVVTRFCPWRRADGVALTTHEGLPSTEIRYSKAVLAIVVALVACLAMLCGLAALDFASPTTGVPAAPAGAVLSGVATLFFLSFFAGPALGWLKLGRIVLSPRGIHHRGWTFSSFLPWESLAGITAAYHGTRQILVIAYPDARWERRQLGGLWKLDRLPPAPMIEIDTSKLTVDPTLAYHLMRFYVENPASRTELGTPRSLHRARTTTFP